MPGVHYRDTTLGPIPDSPRLINQVIIVPKRKRATGMVNLPKTIAIIVLGIIVPIVLLVQAYVGVSTLSDRVGKVVDGGSAAHAFTAARENLRSANDYALISLMMAERTNAAVVVNKQIMKISVMQIGFAVISIGLMFVVLGITDGGGAGTFGAGGVTIDFKTGSTGALVFVVGAAMAAAGGILKNDYNTVPIPAFVESPAQGELQNHTLSIEAYRQCNRKPGIDAQECFSQLFRQINGGPLQ